MNCASIPDTLIEAELFGYEEGAFTGARRKGSVGKIVQARNMVTQDPKRVAQVVKTWVAEK